MRRSGSVWVGLLVVLAALPACETSRPAPAVQSSAAELAVHLAPRVGVERALSKLDVRAGRVLLGLSQGHELRAETDQRPLYELALWEAASDELRLVRSDVRTAALGEDAVFAVTSGGLLVRIDGAGDKVLFDRARGKPTVLADGSVAVARAGSEPGETDIWLATAGGVARPIAAGPGPDDLPIALPDGRLAFVSGRSGIASLWIADPSTNMARQLTNRGLTPGKPLTGFVPPPLEVLGVSATEIRYDAGDAEGWSVDLATGAAAPSAARLP
jgi:hypothetical protein